VTVGQRSQQRSGDSGPIAVIIPARDEALRIRDCLRHVFDQTRPPDEIIVVDNGSRDATAQIALSLGATVVVEGRRSSYAARNAGIEACSSPSIAFTDADCRPRRDWLHNGLLMLDIVPIVGGKVVQAEGRTAIGRYDSKVYLDQAHAVENLRYAATANLFIRRSVAEALGGFESGLMSGGDVDFCWRAERAGFSIEYAADAIVDHLVRDSLLALTRRSWRLGSGHAGLCRRHEAFASICPISSRRLRASAYERSILRGRGERFARLVAESTMLASQSLTTWRNRDGV
jgi:glycosyltransferase involved in cell wall biosynthesis